MRKRVTLVVALSIAFGVLAMPASAHWEPGDDYKMHYPQLPDTTGWAIGARWGGVYPTLGDDWECTESGWVKEIHFWGAWQKDSVATEFELVFSIWSNNPGPPSKPQQVLWEVFVDYVGGEGLDVVEYVMDQPLEGYYDPILDEIYENDHKKYYQYTLTLDPDDWFWQEAGTIYWLVIETPTVDPQHCLGWKTSRSPHFMDNSVVLYEWIVLRDPITYEDIDLAFVISGDAGGEVPAVSRRGLLVLTFLLAGAGVFAFFQRRRLAQTG